MKKNKKGFTLIELLAVIVILAVLILLAMPAVLRLMEKARKNAFVTETESLVKIAETAYTNESMSYSENSGYVIYTLEYLMKAGYTDKKFAAGDGCISIVASANSTDYAVSYQSGSYYFDGDSIEDIRNGITTGDNATSLPRVKSNSNEMDVTACNGTAGAYLCSVVSDEPSCSAVPQS